MSKREYWVCNDGALDYSIWLFKGDTESGSFTGPFERLIEAKRYALDCIAADKAEMTGQAAYIRQMKVSDCE
jgi:hypothetical protein